MRVVATTPYPYGVSPAIPKTQEARYIFRINYMQWVRAIALYLGCILLTPCH
jgi:hypothetical protein